MITKKQSVVRFQKKLYQSSGALRATPHRIPGASTVNKFNSSIKFENLPLGEGEQREKSDIFRNSIVADLALIGQGPSTLNPQAQAKPTSESKQAKQVQSTGEFAPASRSESEHRSLPLTSRLPGFFQLSRTSRVDRIAELCSLTETEASSLLNHPGGLPIKTADLMVENVIGILGLPLGVGVNFLINNREFIIPMAVEEPSVIAGVSFAAKLARIGGGFEAESDESLMIGQVQLANYGDADQAREVLLSHREELLALANSFHPSMVKRGGGAKDIEIRVLDAPEGKDAEKLLILHLIVDTRDAMGANLINTMTEGISPLVEKLTGGKVYLRILSNLCDRRLARASCKIPFSALASTSSSGDEIAQGIYQASRFALADPYRAATHNKGIMNGIDAVAIATGNDWRAIEAGAHAFAAQSGKYLPISKWSLEDRYLVGTIELPLAVGTVGGSISSHPHVQIAHKILGNPNARELAGIMAAAGLAQNLAALRALGSEGIQKGHMAQHKRKE